MQQPTMTEHSETIIRIDNLPSHLIGFINGGIILVNNNLTERLNYEEMLISSLNNGHENCIMLLDEGGGSVYQLDTLVPQSRKGYD